MYIILVPLLLCVLNTSVYVRALCFKLQGRCNDPMVNKTDRTLTRPFAVHTFHFMAEHYCEELYCCAEKGSTITWYKDGIHQGGSKRVRLKRGERNQTLVINSVIRSDEGNYSCTVTMGNISATFWKYALIEPRIGDYQGLEVISIKPVDQEAILGSNVTFICEGDFGSENILTGLPYTVTWYRNGDAINSSLARHHLHMTYRNNRQFHINTLYITNIQEEDYDKTYTCRVDQGLNHPAETNVSIIRPSSTVPPPDVTTYKVIIGTVTVAGVWLLVFIILILVWKYNLEIKLCVKNKFGKFEMTDDMLYHALVVYPSMDDEVSNFVTEELSNNFERKLGYRLCIPELDFTPGKVIGEEYVRHMKVSCCVLLIISPSFLDNAWCYWTMEVALKRKQKVIFIKFDPITNKQTRDCEKLQSAMLVMDTIKWPSQVTDRRRDELVKTLRLKLPRLINHKIIHTKRQV